MNTKKPLKIAIIENSIIATNTIRQKLCTEFLAHGHIVTILTNGTQEQISIAKSNGFNVIEVGQSNQNPKDILRYISKLHGGLKKCEANVCLTFTIRPAIWGNIVTRLLKIPTITNITGIGPLFSSNNIAYKGARFLYKFVLKKTAKIFFQNNEDMNIFLQKKFVDISVVERIPGSGVDHEFYAPRAKKNVDGKFKFLFIGRLVKDKGIGEYVEAAKRIKQSNPEIEFQVLGPIWKQNLKHNIVLEAEVDHWVKEGWINYLGEATDVRDYVADVDCIVLPSYREGMSNVLLEASSMEKPCITTDTTGCRDIVEEGKTGFLCKVQNADDLAKKIKMMYDLPEMDRVIMGQNAREKIIREFDKRIVVNAYLRAVEKYSK